jgi:hypothetical protein
MMIMYAINFVEGSDMPPQRPRDPNERLGKTVSLLLCLCKSIYSRGFVVILDSGFCVLQGIVELWKKGVYAAAVIKKRKYWPKHVPGDAMDAEKMEGKEVGCDYNSIPGTLEGVPYDLVVLKDAGYIYDEAYVNAWKPACEARMDKKILFKITEMRRAKM